MALQVSDNRGFAALLGVLIFGGTCVAIAVSMVFSATRSMQAVLVMRQAYEAKAIAETCAELALQAIHDNTGYTGTGGISLGKGSCTYTVTHDGGEVRTISASASVGRIIKTLDIETGQISPTIHIASWSEE